MRHSLSRLLAWIAVCVASLFAAALAIAQPLPSDSRLVTGELPNGLRYIVRQHNNPPGRAVVWMHVGTGSLNETDRQRGIAHYLEHMSFNGSEHFPPGSVIPFFQSLGLTFGQHQNAFTSFDQTVFQLALPDNKVQTLDKAMLFMSDVSGRLSLIPKEIDDERQIILEERRTRLGGRQRVQDYYLEHLIPGSIFGQRIPIGTEESIKGLGPEDFHAYYGKWYVPSNMTVMVVADMDPKVVVEEITKNFGEGPRKPRPTGQDIGVKPYDKSRAIVASDAELTDAEVQMIWVQPALPPTTTKELMRARTVDEVALWIFDRRLEQKVAEGKVSFHGASVSSDDLFHSAQLSEATAHGEPAKWKSMLSDLTTEVQRAHLHGFTDQEIGDARKELIAGAERAVETEATLPALAMVRSYNESVASGEPIMSAAQELDLTKEIVPTITADEASKRFSEMFDTSRPLTFSLQLPSSAEVPTEEQLVALGAKDLEAKPESEAAAERPTTLLKKIPEPGKIVETSNHEASGVTSAWLENGTSVHVRKMDYKKDEVIVTITIAAGEIQETAADHGISNAASVAWAKPATSTLSSTAIRDLMTGKKVSVGGRPGMDTMTLFVSGSPEELEDGMQLAYLMLTDPLIETATFDQWKEQQKQGARMRKMVPEGVLNDLAAQTLFPKDEPRAKPMEPEDIDKLQPSSSQAWLRKVLGAAPIEVSVVGDIDQAKAMELVQRYVGSLPKRERIGKGTLASLRHIDVPKGPLNESSTLRTKTDKAAVLSGFFGTDYEKLRDVRLLNVAGRILSTRAIEGIREKDQLAYSPQVGSSPAMEFPGHGMVILFTTTAPEKVDALLKAVSTLFDDFGAKGPTEDEMTVARKQFANILDEQMRDLPYWTRTLSTLSYRGTSLDDVLGAPAAYQSFTAAQVRECFNRYYKPESRFAISVKPTQAENDEPETPQKPSEPPVHSPQPGRDPTGPAVDPAPPMPK